MSDPKKMGAHEGAQSKNTGLDSRTDPGAKTTTKPRCPVTASAAHGADRGAAPADLCGTTAADKDELAELGGCAHLFFMLDKIETMIDGMLDRLGLAKIERGEP